jgi:3-(3-hydroxy-phenyl)propionate hydroxylase
MGDVEAVVVGAGPTGLAMAIELARARVFRTGSSTGRSSRLDIPRRSWCSRGRLEQLDGYGIGQRFVEAGRRLDGVAIYDRRRRIAALRLDGLASRHPYLVVVPQTETERLLGEHLHSLGAEVDRGTELVAVHDDGGAVQVELRDRDAITERVAARWLVGCDGVHSTVREAIEMPFVGDEVGQLFQLGDVELRGRDLPGDELRVHLQMRRARLHRPAAR